MKEYTIDESKFTETIYSYGMRLRGFSIGCQPKDGLVERRDDKSGLYYDVLVYERKLTDREMEDYELDYIGEENMVLVKSKLTTDKGENNNEQQIRV